MRKILTVAVAGVLALAACGSDDGDTKDTETTAPAATDASSDSSTTEHNMDDMEHDMEDMEHGGDEHVEGDHDEASGEGAGAQSVSDKGLGMLSNGHHEEMVYEELSAADQADLDELLEISRETAEQWPTLGDFKAAGATRGGPFTPGLGIHYTLVSGDSFNADGLMDETDVRNPLVVIFDGTEDSAKIAGYMYYSFAEKQPEGFPGGNDTWHYHTNICTQPAADGTNAPFGADRSVDPAACKKLGGVLMPKTQWMVHVWSIPGYEVSEADGGVFAEVNPSLTCPDGTYFIMPEKNWVEHPTNFCQSELTSA